MVDSLLITLPLCKYALPLVWRFRHIEDGYWATTLWRDVLIAAIHESEWRHYKRSLQSVNNGILLFSTLKLKHILSIRRSSPEPLIFGPLTEGRRGILGVATANPWKLSNEDCEPKIESILIILCIFQHLTKKALFKSSSKHDGKPTCCCEACHLFSPGANKPVLPFCSWLQENTWACPILTTLVVITKDHSSWY